MDEIGFGSGFANLELAEASLTQACITKATGSGDVDWWGRFVADKPGFILLGLSHRYLSGELIITVFCNPSFNFCASTIHTYNIAFTDYTDLRR